MIWLLNIWNGLFYTIFEYLFISCSVYGWYITWKLYFGQILAINELYSKQNIQINLLFIWILIPYQRKYWKNTFLETSTLLFVQSSSLLNEIYATMVFFLQIPSFGDVKEFIGISYCLDMFLIASRFACSLTSHPASNYWEMTTWA